MSAYRITAVGFENTEALFFRTSIEMASEYDIAAWVFAEDQDADATLVNADREEVTSKFIIDKPRQANTRPILIGCSSSGKKGDSFTYTLQKPITYSMIVTLLLKLELELASVAQTKHDELSEEEHANSSLHEQISSETGLQPATSASSTSHPIGGDQHQKDQHIGIDDGSDDGLLMDSESGRLQPEVASTSDTNAQQAANDQSKTTTKSGGIKTDKNFNCRTVRFHEETRLLGLLRKPHFLGYPTEITHHIYPPLRIYPDLQIFAHRSNLRLSAGIFTTHSSGFSIHELMRPRKQAPPDSWNTQPLWLLYYLATLYGSEGRLKENIGFYDELSLTSKPDFDIVPNHLDYRKIADFMMTKEPQDLNSIAYGSGVDIKRVIDFCNACEEIDIIDRTPSSQSKIGLSSKTSPEQKTKTSRSDKDALADKGIIKRLYQYLQMQRNDRMPPPQPLKDT